MRLPFPNTARGRASRASLVLAFVLATAAGCSGTPGNENFSRIAAHTLAGLQSGVDSATAVPIDEVLKAAEPLQGPRLDVEFNAQAARVAEIDGARLLVRAFTVAPDAGTQLVVDSYVVPATGPDYIFIPALSAYDHAGKQLASASPETRPRVHAGSLRLGFQLPEGTRYVAIHTDPRYLAQPAVSGAEGGAQEGRSFSGFGDPGTAVAVGAVIGGALGGAIAGALASSSASGGAAQQAEDFRFGPGGVIDLRLL